jgi:hypothetical protein
MNIEFMKRAEQESAKHGGGRSIWSAIWEMRKQLPEFAVRRPNNGPNGAPGNANTTALLLSDGWGALCHNIISSWSRKGSYPIRENVRCLTWSMNEQAQWIRLRQQDCPICVGLGKAPNFIAFYLLWNYALYQGTNGQWVQGGRLEVLPAWRDAVRASITQSIEAQAPVWGMPVSAVKSYFDVYRGPQKNASRIGDMWIFKGFHKGPEVDGLIKSLPDLNKFYPLIDDATAIRMLAGHKHVADTHRMGEEPEYNVEGMTKLGMPTTQPAVPQMPAQFGPPQFQPQPQPQFQPQPQPQPQFQPQQPQFQPQPQPAAPYPGFPQPMGPVYQPPAPPMAPQTPPPQMAPQPQPQPQPTTGQPAPGPAPSITAPVPGMPGPMWGPATNIPSTTGGFPTAPQPQFTPPSPPQAPPTMQVAPPQPQGNFVSQAPAAPPQQMSPDVPRGPGPTLEDLDNFEDVTPGDQDPDYPAPSDPKV